MRRSRMRLAEPLVSGAAEPWKRRKLAISILDHELAQVAIAELLTEFEEHPIANLLADGHARAQLARLGRRRDLEEIDVQRPADRLPNGAARKPVAMPAVGRQRRALAAPQLVDRTIEDDERQDVRFFERRRAAQFQLRPSEPLMCTSVLPRRCWGSRGARSRPATDSGRP